MSAVERIRKALDSVPGRQPNSIIAVYAGDVVEAADAIPAAEQSEVVKGIRLGAVRNQPGRKVGINAEHLDELLDNHERTRPAPPPPPPPPPAQIAAVDPVASDPAPQSDSGPSPEDTAALE